MSTAETLTVTVDLPHRFVDDSIDREGGAHRAVIVKKLARTYRVQLDREAFYDLLSDCDYYSDPADFDERLLGLCLSARATARRLRALEVPWGPADEPAPKSAPAAGPVPARLEQPAPVPAAPSRPEGRPTFMVEDVPAHKRGAVEEVVRAAGGEVWWEPHAVPHRGGVWLEGRAGPVILAVDRIVYG